MSRQMSSDTAALERIMAAPSKEIAAELLGLSLWPAQVRIFDALDVAQVIGISSCHSSGKTKAAAAAILIFLLKHPFSLVLATSSSFRQVEKQIWAELRLLFPLVKPLLPGSELLQAELRLAPGWGAFGLSVSQPENFQGYHAANLLIVADESTGIPEEIWPAIDSLTSGGNAKLMALSNPTRSVGYFANLFRNPPADSELVRISCFETPNFIANGIKTVADLADAGKPANPVPAALSVAWAKSKLEQWGENSVWFKIRVLGQFVDADSDSVFNLDDIWAAIENEELEAEGPITILCDPSAYGDDRFVCLKLKGDVVCDAFVRHGKVDPMKVCGEIVDWLRGESVYIKVDSGGLGAPIYARLCELFGPSNVEACNSSESPFDDDYLNARAERFFALQKRLRNREIAIRLPKDLADDLIADLTAIKYKVVESSGKVKILDKAEIKKQTGGISPDLADALALLSQPRQFVSKLSSGRRRSRDVFGEHDSWNNYDDFDDSAAGRAYRNMRGDI